MKRKRIVWRVLWDQGHWEVRRGKNWVCLASTKALALQLAREKARAHHGSGGLSQLVVHGKDGRIQTEHTYGADPRRSKG